MLDDSEPDSAALFVRFEDYDGLRRAAGVLAEMAQSSAAPAPWRSPAEALPSDSAWIPFFGADMDHDEMPHFGHYGGEEGWWCDLCAEWVADVTLWYDLPLPGATE